MPAPQPDAQDWVWSHGESILAAVVSACLTGAAALWRIATWSAKIEAQLEAIREEKKIQTKEIFDRLDQMNGSSAERHHALTRELDQIRADIRLDRDNNHRALIERGERGH